MSDLIERLRGILLPCDTCAGTGTVWAPTSGPDPDDLDLCHVCNGKGAVKHPITNEASAELERLTKENAQLLSALQHIKSTDETLADNERLTAENAALKDHNGTIVKLGAENDRLWKENAALRAFIQESADELCSYGDNCPPFIKSNHGRCDPCKARAALDSARAKESGDG